MAEHPFFPKESKFSERRFLPRWKVKNRLLYKTQNHDQERQGFTYDISCTGAAIRIPEELQYNQKLKITLYLSESKAVTVDAIVLWVRVCANEKRVGLQFMEVAEETQQALLDHAFEIRPDQVSKNWFQGWDNEAT